MIIVVGRGHSGTRAISRTLSESGVFMGGKLNESGDLIPADDMYEACRVMARHVKHLGGVRWDFSKLHTVKIDQGFIKLVSIYLQSVLNSSAEYRGWKLPETTLVLPWIVRMFPEARYIYWVRDPRDSIIGSHITDDLADFGVPYDSTDDVRKMRAVSWKYQREIVRGTPRPENWIEVRFEDFVLSQESTLARLKRWLGFPLATIPVNQTAVGRWENDSDYRAFEFLIPDLKELGYV